jgi:hypothetical protein
MKKKTKKLALNRETLRDLEEGKMRQIVGATGGGIPESGCLTCQSNYNTCGRPTIWFDCTDYC